MNKIARFVKDESGATAIEYGLIAAAIGLMLVAVMPVVSSKLNEVFLKIVGALNTAAGWTGRTS